MEDSQRSDSQQPGRSVRVDGLSNLVDTPERIQRRRLSAATRTLMTRLMVTTAGAEDLAAAADRLDAIGELLGDLPTGQKYEGFSEAANAGPALRAMMAMFSEEDRGTGSDSSVEDTPERFAFFDQSPLIGLSNPLSPPLILDYDVSDDHRLRGVVNFGPAYEGPPGCVHGGYVAAVFDELLGATQSLSGTAGMTAHLGVDYRSPTPLGEDLEMFGWVDRTDGRKIWTSATIHAGERLCAEATALFLSLEGDTFQTMLDTRGS